MITLVSEQLKNWLAISSLADNVSFGIEYYLRRDMGVAKNLLTCGVLLCNELKKGYELSDKKEINGQEYDDLIMFDAYFSSKKISKDQITEEMEKIKEAKKIIESMIQGEVYTEKEARDIQEFFIKLGVDPLKRAFDELEKNNKSGDYVIS